jgi:hypothetical protein
MESTSNGLVAARKKAKVERELVAVAAADIVSSPDWGDLPIVEMKRFVASKTIHKHGERRKTTSAHFVTTWKVTEADGATLTLSSRPQLLEYILAHRVVPTSSPPVMTPTTNPRSSGSSKEPPPLRRPYTVLPKFSPDEFMGSLVVISPARLLDLIDTLQAACTCGYTGDNAHAVYKQTSRIDTSIIFSNFQMYASFLVLIA